VAGGGDVARKGGPGIGRADLLVVNKTDLAPYVGVDVPLMVADALAAREGRAVLALSRDDAGSVASLRAWVLGMLAAHRAGTHVPQDPGPMAPHFHADEADEDHPEGGHVHAHDHGNHAHEHNHDHDRDPARR
jgi:urease accessory protein